MKYVLTPLLGLLLSIVGFFGAVVGMPIVVWLIKWDSEPTTESWWDSETQTQMTYTAIRGDFPAWLKWFAAPDDRCPGNLFEAAIRRQIEGWGGRRWASYVNFSWRNQMLGMAAAFGRPATEYIPEVVGFYEKDGVWQRSYSIGFARVVVGHQVYRLLDMTFLAVPVFTLKRQPWLLRFAFWLDVAVFRVVTLGKARPGETISAASWSLKLDDKWQGRFWVPVIDWLALRFGDTADHCKRAYAWQIELYR